MNLHKENFINAGINGNLKFIIEYIKEIDVNKQTLLCESVLRNAAYNGHLDIVKYIHEQGISIHTYHELALRFAVEGNHLSVVKYLTDQGADIHIKNDLPFRISFKKGFLEIMEYLIQHKANVELITDDELLIASQDAKEFLESFGGIKWKKK